MAKKIKVIVLTTVLAGGAIIGATANATINDQESSIIDQYATDLVLNNISATPLDDVDFDGKGDTTIVANIDFYASKTSKDGESVKAELFKYNLSTGEVVGKRIGNTVDGTTKVYKEDKLHYAKVD
jgi:hypothetical protein